MMIRLEVRYTATGRTWHYVTMGNEISLCGALTQTEPGAYVTLHPCAKCRHHADLLHRKES